MCRKLNMSLDFITQSYFFVPKDVRLNSTYCFIMKINNRIEKNILHLIILQILTITILRTFIENIQKNLLVF